MMTNDQSRLWELLGKQAAGEIDHHEMQELHRLMHDCGEDVQYMMNVLDHYWESVQDAPEKGDVAAAYERHFPKTLHRDAGGERQPAAAFRSVLRMKRMWPWAAAIALCITGGWYLYCALVDRSSEMNVVATRNGSKTKVNLPDGTLVWLNAGSKLTYPNDFQHVSKREVTLSGEAYFEVRHDPDRIFLIHTDYLDIRDLGTSFNVKAYPDELMAEATLISGSIEVSLKGDPDRSLVLKPHEKVSYYSDQGRFRLEGDNKDIGDAGDYTLQPLQGPARLEVTRIRPLIQHGVDTVVVETAWTRNQLVFQSENFSRLAARMERWYNVTIQITDPEVRNYLFTGIFESETLEQALKELQMIRPLHYQINKDTVLVGR